MKKINYAHGTAKKVGVLLVNLGTPHEPTTASVRTYLAEFLSDKRVVEIPAILWKIILHGIILRVRPAKSAKKYASIWTKNADGTLPAGGSPLMVHTVAQTQAFAASVGRQYPDVIVDFAMRYGQPSIAAKMQAMQDAGVDKLLILPLYPQYSATTTATVWDEVMRVSQGMRNPPELRFVKHYHDDAGYIAALADKVRQHWAAHPPTDSTHTVFTFHGLPKRNLMLGDPYHCECYKTARLLREALGLLPDQVTVTFQSRFGRAEWLQPYTEPTLEKLALQYERVDVFCPGFTGDCLETLEEIDMEAREAFLHAGHALGGVGQTFHYITALNESPLWLGALHTIAMQHLQGWNLGETDAVALGTSRSEALRFGAAD